MTQEKSKITHPIFKFFDGKKNYLFINITVMHRDTEFVVLNFCSFNVFGTIDKGTKNLQR